MADAGAKLFRLTGGVLFAVCLTACGASDRVADGSAAEAARVEEAAYRPPPAALAVQRLADGSTVISGVADAGARVRLASPDGAVTQATSDNRQWRVRLPPSTEVRLFGLAAVETGRTIQSEGYLAITPGGRAARLRAGAGAWVLQPPSVLCILAVDYDRKGGAVVSGAGRPGDEATVLADDVARGRTTIDATGRFALAFDEPLTVGPHRLEAVDGAQHAQAALTMSPPAALTAGPYRAAREPGGWRIDWLTPGGGVQTTLIIATREAAT